MADVLRLELRRSRSLLLWLSVVLVGYGGFLGLLYPTVRENAAMIEEYISVYPRAFMEAFGMTGSLADPGIFYTTYIGSWIWPIVAAIAGVLLGTRTVAADLERGFLALPLSTPISRARYLGVAIVVQVVVLAILSVVSVVGVLIAGAVVGAGFDTGRFLLVTPLTFAFGSAVLGAATLLSVITLSRGRAGGVVAGILIVMYLLEVGTRLQPDLDLLGLVSIFRYFDTTPVIADGALDLVDHGVLLLIGMVTWVLAVVLFRHRDLAA